MWRQIHLRNQSFNINQRFTAHPLVLVCLLCNCRLSLFWWSSWSVSGAHVCTAIVWMKTQTQARTTRGSPQEIMSVLSQHTWCPGENVYTRHPGAGTTPKAARFPLWMSFKLYINTCKPASGRAEETKECKSESVKNPDWRAGSPGVRRGRLNNSALRSFWLLCNPVADAGRETCEDHLAACSSPANFHLRWLQRSEAKSPPLAYESTSFVIFIGPLKGALVRGRTPTVCLLPQTKHRQERDGEIHNSSRDQRRRPGWNCSFTTVLCKNAPLAIPDDVLVNKWNVLSCRVERGEEIKRSEAARIASTKKKEKKKMTALMEWS